MPKKFTRPQRAPVSVPHAPISTVATPLVERPSVLQSAKEGFGLGFGLSASQAIFRSIFGGGGGSGGSGGSNAAPAQPVFNACVKLEKEYDDCLLRNDQEKSYCVDQLTALYDCEKKKNHA